MFNIQNEIGFEGGNRFVVAQHRYVMNFQFAVGDLIDTTSGAGFIPEVWSDAIYSFFFQANKLRNSVTELRNSSGFSIAGECPQSLIIFT